MRRFLFYSITLLALLQTNASYALPEGGQVRQGHAEFSQIDHQLMIQQQSEQAVIEFDHFSIAEHERVQFIQPNQNSLTINRITGGNASDIMGQLEANGHLFIINPAGILFGPHAQVKVGSLTASTLDADFKDWDLSSGILQLKRSSSPVLIENQGHIEVETGGHILLLSPHIENKGTLIAQLGQIQLISADGAELSFKTSGLPGIAITEAAMHSWIENTGELSALGGLIELTAQAESTLWDSVINQAGIINADTIESHQGHIRLTSNANIHLANNSLIQANGNGTEHAGRVDIIAEQFTVFRNGAEIKVRGGDDGGNGGFVDTSGFAGVEIQGQVDTRAPIGETGHWLIDPFNVTIEDTNTNIDLSAGTFTPTNTGSTISATSLANNLQTSNITITTDTVGGNEDGDITVVSDINLDNSDGFTLTLNAVGSININADIADNNTGTVDNTNLDLVAVGNIAMANGTTLNAGGGTISMDAGGQISLATLMTRNDTPDAISIAAGGNIQDVGSGEINLVADSANAQTTLTSTSGHIQSLETQVTQLNMSAGNELISIDQLSGDLTLGMVTLNNSSSNGVAISTQDGGISVVDTLSVNGDGNVTLTIGDEDNSQNHNLNLNANIILTGSSTLTLLNSSANIAFDSSGDITLDSGDFTANANAGFITMSEDSVIQSNTGTLSLSAQQGISLGNLQTGSSSNSAVTLSTSQVGSISDTTDNNTADILATNGGIVFDDALTINSLEIDADRISTASNSVGSSQITDINSLRIQDWDGSAGSTFSLTAENDITVNNATVASGNIILNSINGSILDADNDSNTDLSANSITLSAGAQIGALGSDTFTGSDHTLIQVETNQLSLSLNNNHNGIIGIEHSSVQDTGALTLNQMTLASSDNAANIWISSQNNGLDLSNLTLDNSLDAQDTLVLIAEDRLAQNNDSILLPNMDALTLNRLRLDGDQIQLALNNSINNTTLNANDMLLSVDSDHQFSLSANRLDASILNGSLTLNNQAITSSLTDLDNDGFALQATHGNLFVRHNSGALNIDGNIQATDLLDDAVRAGLIDIATSSGDLNIGTNNNVSISSINTVDQDAESSLAVLNTVGSDISILLQITDSTAETRTITLGAEPTTSTISAQGGDIFVASGAGTAGNNEELRQLVVNSNSTITAFNDANDAADGSTTTTEISLDETANIIARTGRSITLTSANLLLDNDLQETINTLIQQLIQDESIQKIAEGTNNSNDSNATTPSQDAPTQPLEKRNIKIALQRALPPCNPENTTAGSYTCKEKQTLENFLSSLMLSKTLPVIAAP